MQNLKSLIDIRFLSVSAFFALVAIVFIVVIMNEMFITSNDGKVYQSILSEAPSELGNLRAREEAALNTFQVIDADKDIYQIPIERAMKLEAKEAR